MTRVLLTAFQPYEGWQTNASWLALVELTRDLPDQPMVTTRLYPGGLRRGVRSNYGGRQRSLRLRNS